MGRTKARAQPRGIATAEEVLQTFTRIMRGEITEDTVKRGADGGEVVTSQPPKISERSKAAELLAKRYGLFSDRAADDPPDATEVIGQIEAAMREMKEARDGAGSP